MIQALHSLRGMLAALHERTQREMGHRQIGVASLEVMDELDTRLRAITDVVPADAPVTKSRTRAPARLVQMIASSPTGVRAMQHPR